MAVTKPYGAIASCGNTLSDVLFVEVFGTKTFFYTTAESRSNDLKKMTERAKKKGLYPTFKLLNPKTENND